MKITFKKDFMLGVATAATQIDGGEVNSNWNQWYHLGKIKDGANPAIANDHYQRVRDDLKLMHDLGIQTYRFGVEWARLEPSPGQFDETVFAHYRQEIQMMLDYGIKPLLTLYHFSHPQWFEDQGGFLSAAAPAVFMRYIDQCLLHFADLVDEYITINEPNVYALEGYFFKEWPPGHHSTRECFKIMSILASLHIMTYQRIHDTIQDRPVRVSFAHHLRVFTPEKPRSLYQKHLTAIVQRAFQDALTQACFFGKFSLPLTNPLHLVRGIYVDFIAINYYTRTTISGLKDGTRANSDCNDLGWEIYPQGIVDVAQQLYALLPLDIYITENGTCDRQDTFRSRYIYEHLLALFQSELPIKRYYHWTFIDNFEWIEGENAPFGLVIGDFKHQVRTVKQSGRFYKQLIIDHGVSEETYRIYVEPQTYNRAAPR